VIKQGEVNNYRSVCFVKTALGSFFGAKRALCLLRSQKESGKVDNPNEPPTSESSLCTGYLYLTQIAPLESIASRCSSVGICLSLSGFKKLNNVIMKISTSDGQFISAKLFSNLETIKYYNQN